MSRHERDELLPAMPKAVSVSAVSRLTATSISMRRRRANRFTPEGKPATAFLPNSDLEASIQRYRADHRLQAYVQWLAK
jgi:hypothetical protein